MNIASLDLCRAATAPVPPPQPNTYRSVDALDLRVPQRDVARARTTVASLMPPGPPSVGAARVALRRMSTDWEIHRGGMLWERVSSIPLFGAGAAAGPIISAYEGIAQAHTQILTNLRDPAYVKDFVRRKGPEDLQVLQQHVTSTRDNATFNAQLLRLTQI
jgi:hypothetical protein